MSQPQNTVRIPGVAVEWKVPLWGLVTAGGGLVWSLVAMYFQLAQVSSQMADMQALLRANNATTIQLTNEQALLKYRVEKLESQTGSK